MGVHFLVIVLTAVSFAAAQTPTCNEGFNMSIAGIPLYHWTDIECSDKSQCFIQELETKIYSTKLDVIARYGGCISSSYSPLVKCENLFGPDSTFNPGILINMIPNLKDQFERVNQKFMRMPILANEQVRLLFSSGKGGEQFIEGCYRFLDNIGFNMEKATPLQKPIADMFNRLFLVSNDNFTQLLQRRQIAVANFLVALAQLDTGNSVTAERIYSFISNWERAPFSARKTIYYPLVEKLPELIKLIMPKSLNVDKWYDVIFELLGDVNITEPTKTAKDIVQTIKTAWELPKEYSIFINPILDSIPGIVDLAFTGDPSLFLESLQYASLENTETERLSEAAKNIFKIFHPLHSPMTTDIQTLVRWLPGLAYKLFPENTKEIDRVYNVVADGLGATDLSDPTSTMEKTNISEFILLMTKKLNYVYRIVPDHQESKQINDLIIINIAKTVYDLIPEYTTQLDVIFSTLRDGFKNYPNFNAGGIISSLIINLGKKIPIQITPILHRGQDVMNTIYNDTGLHFKTDEFYAELNNIISDYEEIYPDSEFPDLVRRYLSYFYKSLYGFPQFNCYSTITDWSDNIQWEMYQNCSARYEKETSTFFRGLSEQASDLSVDLQFAVFRALDVDGNMLFKALLDAFPDYDLYIKSMRLLDPSDLKTLMKEYVDWTYTGGPMTVDTLVAAINSTLIKITAKLNGVVKELRSLFSPDSCRYVLCDDNFCNTHDAIDQQEPFTRDPTKRKFGELPETTKATQVETTSIPVTGGETTTTGASGRPNPTMLINALAVWVLAKILM